MGDPDMHISRYKIRNYKGFLESPEMELSPGFNVVVGQNSSGKTALLEALSLKFVGNPHRSLRTAPSPDAQPDPVSVVNLSITVGREELFDFLLAAGGPPLAIVLPAAACDLTPGYNLATRGPVDKQRFIERILSRDTLTFSLTAARDPAGNGNLRSESLPTFGVYPPAGSPGMHDFVEFRVGVDKSITLAGGRGSAAATHEMGYRLFPLLASHIYRFDAQRFNLSVGRFGGSRILSSQAENLPEVLNVLQANPARFREYKALVGEIFPHLNDISVPPARSGGDLQIVVWTVDPESGRVDLARPLGECGTGVGQVLAILYVVLTAVRRQVILIDEPQSFLHPGAVRKLIEVLRQHSSHQYIVATHSPAVIAACEPETITLARLGAGGTTLERVEVGKTRSLQLCLSEVGARLGDVFGADNVLWVEGPTEELCFPKIVRGVARRPLMGTAIVGLRRVGDLQGRDAERVLEMLDALSRGASLMPPAVGIIIDSECRTEAEKEGIARRRGRIVRFLPRRMYENYLLDSDAIAAVAADIEGFRSPAVRADEVEALLTEMRGAAEYFCRGSAGSGEGEWLRGIDGARVLRDIFGRLSETRVSFSKVTHSVALTEWLVKHKPERLREVAELLDEVLSAETGVRPRAP